MAAASTPAPARAPEAKPEPRPGAQPQAEPQPVASHSKPNWQKYATPVLVVLLAAAVVLTMTWKWNAWEGGRIEQITDDAYHFILRNQSAISIADTASSGYWTGETGWRRLPLWPTRSKSNT
jgi:hypothetical protein